MQKAGQNAMRTPYFVLRPQSRPKLSVRSTRRAAGRAVHLELAVDDVASELEELAREGHDVLDGEVLERV